MLSPGVHHFTTIDIPARVTVTTTDSGVLEMRATGDVTIAGSDTALWVANGTEL